MIFYNRLDDDYLVLGENAWDYERITIPRGENGRGAYAGDALFPEGERCGDVCIQVKSRPPGEGGVDIVARALSEALERCKGTLYVVNRCPGMERAIESLLRQRRVRYEMFLARHHLGVMLPAYDRHATSYYFRSIYSGSAARRLAVRVLAGLGLHGVLRRIMDPAVQVFVIARQS
ncbi:MAG: hypothetical protein WAR22_06525 [Desulfomonilia bacterium]|jgi:hypothetical protein